MLKMKVPKFITPLSDVVDSVMPDSLLIKLQEMLIRGGLYFRTSDLVTILLLVGILLAVVGFVVASALNLYPILVAIGGLILPFAGVAGFIFIMSDKRVDSIEKETPDFLRQLASLLRAGMGLEAAMEDISKQGDSPLIEELKRAVIEIKVGRSFDEAMLAMSDRLGSKNLDRTFRMILEGRKAGGSLSDVIETISDDLRATMALQRERKSSVLMSVMFLIIAAIIAAPFALGMTGIYTAFMESAGSANPMAEASQIAASGYIIIHSFLVGILMGIIMYGSPKKGLKYGLPLAVAGYVVFWLVSTFGGSVLVGM